MKQLTYQELVGAFEKTEPYTSTSALFRSLSASEVKQFQQKAREAAIENLHKLVNPVFHPVYNEEIGRIIAQITGPIVH